MVEYIDINKINNRDALQGNQTVRYGNLEISIPFQFVQKYITLQAKVDQLESELNLIKRSIVRELSDEQAKEEIVKFIKSQKASGNNRISIIDITETLSLPIEQIDKIMKTLEKRGLKEID